MRRRGYIHLLIRLSCLTLLLTACSISSAPLDPAEETTPQASVADENVATALAVVESQLDLLGYEVELEPQSAAGSYLDDTYYYLVAPELGGGGFLAAYLDLTDGYATKLLHHEISGNNKTITNILTGRSTYIENVSQYFGVQGEVLPGKKTELSLLYARLYLDESFIGLLSGVSQSTSSFSTQANEFQGCEDCQREKDLLVTALLTLTLKVGAETYATVGFAGGTSVTRFDAAAEAVNAGIEAFNDSTGTPGADEIAFQIDPQQIIEEKKQAYFDCINDAQTQASCDPPQLIGPKVTPRNVKLKPGESETFYINFGNASDRWKLDYDANEISEHIEITSKGSGTLSPGAYADVVVQATCPAGDLYGRYNELVTLLTNDPLRSLVRVDISFICKDTKVVEINFGSTFNSTWINKASIKSGVQRWAGIGKITYREPDELIAKSGHSQPFFANSREGARILITAWHKGQADAALPILESEFLKTHSDYIILESWHKLSYGKTAFSGTNVFTAAMMKIE